MVQLRELAFDGVPDQFTSTYALFRQLPPQYGGLLQGLSVDLDLTEPERQKRLTTLERLRPTLETVGQFHHRVAEILRQHHTTEEEMFALLDSSPTLRDRLTPEKSKKIEWAYQYFHIYQVLSTTLLLKKALIEMGLPDRTVAYQMGTGFPLPAEVEGIKKMAEFKFGEGILQYFHQPAVAGHTQAAINVYKVTGKDGGEITLLALAGRDHSYSKIGTDRPHLSLAVVPRVLKGIGVESILTTLASGFDTVPRENLATPTVGDYGYIMMTSDMSGMAATTHPGVGDQTLIGLFGGPFQEGPTQTSSAGLTATFEDAITSTYPDRTYTPPPETAEEIPQTHPVPSRYPAFIYDGSSTPDFEKPPDWMRARLEAEALLQHPETLPEDIMAVVPSKDVQIAQGMGSVPEIAAYHQVDASEERSLLNRRLPFLAIAGCTDGIDPRPEGQSRHISHDEVQAAGKRSAFFLAPVVSNYFRLLADQQHIPIRPR